MAETTCPICGREKNAMSWLPGREWCGGPIDPDAMIECYRLGFERERAALERAEAELVDEQERHRGTLDLLAKHDAAFKKLMDQRDAAESALAQAREACEAIVECSRYWANAFSGERKALNLARAALAAAPRGEPAPERGTTLAQLVVKAWATAGDEQEDCLRAAVDIAESVLGIAPAAEPRAKGETP